MNTRPKNPANARNLNACVIGSSGSGKTRFWLTPQLLQASAGKHGCSYVVVDPKGGTLDQCGAFLQRQGYEIRVFNSIDFSKSMHYNPLSYIRNEADILKFVDTLIANTSGDGKESDPFWRKAETLLYCALIAYIIFEGAPEDKNMNTLVDMISGMEVRENDENFMNAVDYMFKGLEKRKPDCFAVKQYRKYKLASGDISLEGTKEKGIDDYTGTYTADYENFSDTEYVFGGTSIKREAGKELSIDCTLEVTEGTAKVFWISGSDEAVTLIETTGTYSDTITLPDGGNYIGIECEDFTGNIELNIE